MLKQVYELKCFKVNMLDSFLEVSENKQLLIAIVVRFIIQLLLKIEVMKLLSIQVLHYYIQLH